MSQIAGDAREPGYPRPMLAVLCAIGAAMMYALASVLQQRGAAKQPLESSMRFGLLARLLRHPVWVLGLGCDVAGYALQFVALGRGPIVVVQPLLVCGLLFALPVGAAWAGRMLTVRDWLAAIAVCSGLAVFLTVAAPERGRADVSAPVWAALLAGGGAVSAVLVLASRRRAPWQRAMQLSAAAGVIYGVAAALTVTAAHLLGKGVPVLLEHWQPYMLVAAGVVGMLVAQSAFQAGPLDVSLPMMSVVDPVVSILIGALAFEESVASGASAVAGEVLSLVVMFAGVVVLGRSQAMQALHGAGGPGSSKA